MQLKEFQKFAQKGNDPITDTAVMRTGVQLIEANGLFDISCREWRAKTTASRTTSVFKNHFRLAENEYNRAATAASADYNTANATVYQTAPPGFPSPLSNPGSVIPLLAGMTIHDSPFLTALPELAAAVAEASMITERPSSTLQSRQPSRCSHLHRQRRASQESRTTKQHLS